MAQHYIECANPRLIWDEGLRYQIPECSKNESQGNWPGGRTERSISHAFFGPLV